MAVPVRQLPVARGPQREATRGRLEAIQSTVIRVDIGRPYSGLISGDVWGGVKIIKRADEPQTAERLAERAVAALSEQRRDRLD